MSILEFYDLSKENILYSLLIIGGVYLILSSIYKDDKGNYNLSISIFSGFLFNLLFSFLTFPSDTLDTSNFWG